MATTEHSSALTAAIDQCSASDIVRLLRRANQEEMCAGLLDGHAGLADQIDRVAAAWRSHEDTLLIMSGCGTSGRIAYFCASAWNSPHARYCIAGGDRALVLPVENAEDNAEQGVLDLKAAIGSHTGQVVLIGISCGLSAPYVAGQLDYALSHRGSQFAEVVLLGFNRVSAARNVPIEGFPHTFREVAQRVVAEGIVMNPNVGPEPITGSTRMKGGSATKILLDCIYEKWKSPSLVEVPSLLKRYAKACDDAYSNGHDESIGRMIEQAAKALSDGKSVIYVSSARLPGMLALIDASECPPTFGARHSDVMAFVDGGVPGVEKCDAKQFFRPQSGDCVFVIGDHDDTSRMSDNAIALGPFEDSGFGQLVLKLTLNAISTGAFILYGKIYGNRMVDVRLSNNKLYHRAIGIVADIAAVSPQVAEKCIWRALYGDETDRSQTPISEHVAAAAKMERVVPIAILLTRVATVDDALGRISMCPKIKDCFY